MALPSFLTEFAVNQCGEQPKRKLITLHKDIVCCQLGSWSPSWSLTCCKGADCPELGVQRCLWGWDSILKAGLNCSGNKTQVRCNKSRQCDSSSGYLNITLTLQSKLAALQTHTCLQTLVWFLFQQVQGFYTFIWAPQQACASLGYMHCANSVCQTVFGLLRGFKSSTFNTSSKTNSCFLKRSCLL